MKPSKNVIKYDKLLTVLLIDWLPLCPAEPNIGQAARCLLLVTFWLAAVIFTSSLILFCRSIPLRAIIWPWGSDLDVWHARGGTRLSYYGKPVECDMFTPDLLRFGWGDACRSNLETRIHVFGSFWQKRVYPFSGIFLQI